MSACPDRKPSVSTKLPCRLGKPTGEAVTGNDVANRKTLAPAGQASRGLGATFAFSDKYLVDALASTAERGSRNQEQSTCHSERRGFGHRVRDQRDRVRSCKSFTLVQAVEKKNRKSGRATAKGLVVEPWCARRVDREFEQAPNKSPAVLSAEIRKIQNRTLKPRQSTVDEWEIQ